MSLTQEQANYNRIDLTRKKKPSNAELMAQQAAAAQQEPEVIDTYITHPEKPKPQKPEQKQENDEEKNEGKKKGKKKTSTGKGKTLRSFYCDDIVYEKLQKLARYRAVNSGDTNGQGQGIGAGTLINEAAAQYVKQHEEELRQWEMFERATKRFFEPDNLARFMAEQKRLAAEQLQREIEADQGG